MSYSFLSQSIRAQDLVLWIDLRRWNQTFLDLSSYGNDGTPANLHFGGGGAQFDANNGVISVTDAASLRSTAITLMALGPFDRLERAGVESYLLSRIDSGTPLADWSLAIDNTPRLMFHYDQVGVILNRTLNYDYRGNRCLAVTATDGATPIGYADGVSIGNFSGNVNLNAPAGIDVDLGNTDSTNLSQLNPGWAYLVWNRVLTATEISVAYGELMALPGGSN